MTYARVAGLLEAGEVVVLDGAMGSEIQVRAPELPRAGFGDLATVQAPELVRAIHTDYIAAGADVITTNTFRASRIRARIDGVEDRVEELNREAVRLARDARAQAGADERVAIAGSVSTASGNEARGDPTDGAAYAEQAGLLASAGVDLIVLEMLRDVEQSRQAIAGAKATGLPVWAGFSCVTDVAGVVRMDGSDLTLEETMVELAPLGFDVALIMHTEVDDIAPGLEVLSRHWGGRTGAYPHVGTFDRATMAWRGDDSVEPDDFAELARGWRAAGVQVIGTCCGLGPRFTAALDRSLR